MANFDLFRVKLSGIGDSGQLRAEVTVGFSDDVHNEHLPVVVPVYLTANLDASLRELREQAKDAALELLRKATQLLEQHSTDELHQAALDRLGLQTTAMEQTMQDEIQAALRGSGA